MDQLGQALGEQYTIAILAQFYSVSGQAYSTRALAVGYAHHFVHVEISEIVQVKKKRKKSQLLQCKMQSQHGQILLTPL